MGAWGPIFHSLLPPPKLILPIPVHDHILTQERKETDLLLSEPCCSQTQAQLRSRSATPTPGSEGPSHHTVTLGRAWVQELCAGEEQLSPGTVTSGLALPLTYCLTSGSQNKPNGLPRAVM